MKSQGLNLHRHSKGFRAEAEDVKAWLARERDKRSWASIAKHVWKANTPEHTDAAKSKARRAWKRVESYWTKGRSHLTGAQAAWERQQKKWEEENLAPGFWEGRNLVSR